MKKPFIVFNRDPDTGARPGLVQGETYTTDKEVERNKYEVLESYSATYLKELEGTQTDPAPIPDPEPAEDEEEPEPEPIPEPEPEPEIPEDPEPDTEPEPDPVVEQGLAKDYPGTGWYKATDTGVVYNKDVPEGETHIFEGDPTEYISVWRNEGLDLSNFGGTPEEIQKMVYWHNNLHRFATSNVTDMSYWMFGYGYDEFYDEVGISPDDINTDVLNIAHYDTSNVTNMSYMFSNTISFNQPLDNFDTSNVTNMDSMFSSESFNQPLNHFDTSNVTTMRNMFEGAVSFNQDISSWDTSKVTRMDYMFNSTYSFNQDISSWDTSNVTNMVGMFNHATSFNQDLSKWCVPDITAEDAIFAARADNWTLPKPVWGTCPRGEDGSEVPPVLEG